MQIPKTYVCPMCHDVQSEKPGKCPKCGMNLVESDSIKSIDYEKHKENKKR